MCGIAMRAVERVADINGLGAASKRTDIPAVLRERFQTASRTTSLARAGSRSK